MNLYQKLFGMKLMAPADDGESGGAAGAADRGDDHIPDNTTGTGEETGSELTAEEQEAADLAAATGKNADETPRDEAGKFAKKAKTDDNGVMIPKSRFDEQVGKERAGREAAERRAAELERQQGQIVRNADLTKASARVQELRKLERAAVVDGDEEKAAQFSSEADRLNVLIATEQSKDLSNAAKDRALEDMRLELTVERIEEKYPALNENSDDFDQDLTDDVLDKQRGYMERERLTPSKALAKAAEYVMSRRTAATVIEAAAEKTGLSAAAKGLDRKTAAVGKNIDASKRQPASVKQAGADSDKHGQTSATPDAGDMTFEEFGALPESTKAKMRGDFVE